MWYSRCSITHPLDRVGNVLIHMLQFIYLLDKYHTYFLTMHSRLLIGTEFLTSTNTAICTVFLGNTGWILDCPVLGMHVCVPFIKTSLLVSRICSCKILGKAQQQTTQKRLAQTACSQAPKMWPLQKDTQCCAHAWACMCDTTVTQNNKQSWTRDSTHCIKVQSLQFCTRSNVKSGKGRSILSLRGTAVEPGPSYFKTISFSLELQISVDLWGKYFARCMLKMQCGEQAPRPDNLRKWFCTSW